MSKTSAPSQNPSIEPADGSSPRELCPNQPLTARLEALLLVSDRPVTEARLAALLGLEPRGAATCVKSAIEELNEQYRQTGRAFLAERLAGGWQLLTLPEYGPLLDPMHAERQRSGLSHAALETLAIIAYRQPIMRAEIEAIRGVACGEVLRGLLERRLVKIVGRAEVLGRPMLYGTTKQFLQVFGLSAVDDLPPMEGASGPRKEPARNEEPQTDDSEEENCTP